MTAICGLQSDLGEVSVSLHLKRKCQFRYNTLSNDKTFTSGDLYGNQERRMAFRQSKFEEAYFCHTQDK